MNSKPKQYQIHDPQIGIAAFSRNPPAVTAWEFLRIAAWKSALIPAAISAGTPEKLEESMQMVMSRLKNYEDVNVVQAGHDFDWDLWQDDVYWMINSTGLLALPGVGYIFATGILGYLCPNSFPVMDRHTIGGVFGWEANTKSSTFSTATYRIFAEHLAKAEVLDWQNLNIHQRDQELMNAMRPLEKSKGACPILNFHQINLPTNPK